MHANVDTINPIKIGVFLCSFLYIHSLMAFRMVFVYSFFLLVFAANVEAQCKILIEINFGLKR